MSDKNAHHLHIVLTHEQVAAEDAKRGLCLLDQVYELMYRIAKQ